MVRSIGHALGRLLMRVPARRDNASAARGAKTRLAVDEARLLAALRRWPSPRPPDRVFLARLYAIADKPAGSALAAGLPAGRWRGFRQEAALRSLLLGQAALMLIALVAGIVIGGLERRPVVTLDVTPLLAAELPSADGWPGSAG